MKKMGKLVIVGLLGVMLLAACGGGAGGDEPTGVVEKVVEAMQTLDVDAAKEYFCEEQKSTMDAALQEGLAELGDLGLDPDELLDAFSIKFADMKYEETSKDGDEAVVHVSGNMSLDFDAEKLKEFFKKAAEAAGQPVGDQELDFVVGIFEAMSGQEAPLDGDVELVKEDGDWVVCSELDFLQGSDLFELPLP